MPEQNEKNDVSEIIPPQSITSAPHISVHKHSFFVNALGAGSVGFLEIVATLPLETVSRRLAVQKRLNADQQFSVKNLSVHNLKATWTQFADIAFARGTSGSLLSRLYPGFWVAGSYKLLQRSMKIPVQGEYRHAMEYFAGDWLSQRFGAEGARSVISAVSGGLTGLTEGIILYPLDTIKVTMQVNPELRDKGIIGLIIDKRPKGLVHGMKVGLLRNVAGSAAFFTANQNVSDYLKGADKERQLSLQEKFASALAAGAASCAVSYPLDVVKSRMQSGLFGTDSNGLKVAQAMYRTEGVGSFFGGFYAKGFMTTLRVGISFAGAQHVIEKISERTISQANQISTPRKP